MPDINTCILEGTLIDDAQTRSGNGKNGKIWELTYFRMTTELDGDKYPTQHSVEAWGQTASKLAGLHKGERVKVKGKIITDSYNDKMTGVKLYKQAVEATEATVFTAPRAAPKAPPPVDDDDSEIPF